MVGKVAHLGHDIGIRFGLLHPSLNAPGGAHRSGGEVAESRPGPVRREVGEAESAEVPRVADLLVEPDGEGELPVEQGRERRGRDEVAPEVGAAVQDGPHAPDGLPARDRRAAECLGGGQQDRGTVLDHRVRPRRRPLRRFGHERAQQPEDGRAGARLGRGPAHDTLGVGARPARAAAPLPTGPAALSTGVPGQVQSSSRRSGYDLQGPRRGALEAFVPENRPPVDRPPRRPAGEPAGEVDGAEGGAPDGGQAVAHGPLRVEVDVEVPARIARRQLDGRPDVDEAVAGREPRRPGAGCVVEDQHDREHGQREHEQQHAGDQPEQSGTSSVRMERRLSRTSPRCALRGRRDAPTPR